MKSVKNDALLHFIPILSQAFGARRLYDQQLTCCIKICIDDPQQFFFTYGVNLDSKMLDKTFISS
jgi:hypothetical protein